MGFYDVDVNRFLGKMHIRVREEAKELQRWSAKAHLFSPETYRFIATLLEKEIEERDLHPNYLAWEIGISNTRLFRVMSGRDGIEAINSTELIKILNYFGYDLNVKIEPMKQKKP